jgi:peptidoglycan hydrolase-like protein with peptidoglycan-binding domain
MQIRTIRRGSRGPLVRKWQDFLRGQDDYLGISDGKFGPKTEASTKAYQLAEGLKPVDGIVGNATWGRAMSDGLELIEGSGKGKASPAWPPRPTNLKPIGHVKRQKVLGVIRYRAAPTKGNPEGIVITNAWQKNNLCRVTVPQLKGVYGAPKSGRVFWHKAAKAQLLALFKAWEMLGLTDRIESWAGSWCARFTRGSDSYLSNHSWASAFDINVPWNMLGRRPALVGCEGCVRELVEVANMLGFWWGGHGWPPKYGRLDGMHFEIAKLMTQAEIDAVLDQLALKLAA